MKRGGNSSSHDRGRPAANQTASNVISDGDDTSVPTSADVRRDSDAEHFRQRVLQDVLNEGLAATWERRARLFEWAAPRRDDFPGRATELERLAKRRELLAIARACRARGTISLGHEGIDDDVRQALTDAEDAEVAA